MKKKTALLLALWIHGWPGSAWALDNTISDIHKALELVQPQLQFTRQIPPAQDRYIPEGQTLQQFRLGVGDNLDLHLWNERLNLSYPLIVNPEGQVFIPRLGTFQASGLTTAALQHQIAARVRQIQPNPVQLSLLLTKVRSVRVLVSGHVQNPGYYTLLWGSRLLEAIQRAGGVRDNGSVRQIELQQSGHTLNLDLYRFHYQGEVTANPILMGSEHIHVPPLGQHVALLGQVNQPGLYEIQAGENLPQLLQLTGGLKPAADRENLLLWAGGLKRNQPQVEPRSLNNLWPLADGDVYYFQTRKLPVEENLLYIYGQVRQAGAVPFKQGMTLTDCLKQAGGPADKADLNAVRLTRLNQGRYETTVINLHAMLFEGQKTEDPVVMPGDMIYIPESFFAVRNINELTTLVLSSLGIVSVVLNLIPRNP